tara:strand:+ start:5132 stop:5278 length:147 start_codon:yes stop_codon:yes gene_type:complete
MDDLTASEIKALIKLVNRDLKFRQSRVSYVKLLELHNKLSRMRVNCNG